MSVSWSHAPPAGKNILRVNRGVRNIRTCLQVHLKLQDFLLYGRQQELEASESVGPRMAKWGHEQPSGGMARWNPSSAPESDYFLDFWALNLMSTECLCLELIIPSLTSNWKSKLLKFMKASSCSTANRFDSSYAARTRCTEFFENRVQWIFSKITSEEIFQKSWY